MASEALYFKRIYGTYRYSTSGDISTPYAPETSKKVKKFRPHQISQEKTSNVEGRKIE